MALISLALLALSAACIIMACFRAPEPVTPQTIVKQSLRFLVLVNTGFGGILAFMGHAFNPDEIARNIGWAAGSPFQFEVAVTNLSFGIVGILSFWVGGTFRIAAATANAIFLLGCGYGHLREMIVRGNTSPLNSGVFLLVSDILFPVLLLLLAFLDYRRLKKDKFKEV